VQPASGKSDAVGRQFVIVEAVGDIERDAPKTHLLGFDCPPPAGFSLPSRHCIIA
jgi:hypothetical protein